MIEVCSCSASLEIRDVGEWSTEALVEAFATWRSLHNHDMGGVSQDGDMPLIHESMSNHERLVDDFAIQDRAPVGFARNEVR